MSNRKLFIICSILFFASLSLLSQISNADPLDHWHLRNPLPTSNLLYGVTYGNGIFVAVGDIGTIITSPEGEIWTIRNSGTSDHLRGIGFGNNIFVAVGFNGTILTSPNGVTWTKRNSNTREILFSVTYGNGIFVTAGDSSILTSQGGVNWTVRERISGLSGVTYGNGTFVAVGYYENNHGTYYAVIYTSTDGISWIKKVPGTVEPLYGVAYGNGIFVAVGFSGTIFTSPDGNTWIERDSQVGSNLRGVVYGRSTFVAVGTSAILTSADGVTWERSTSMAGGFGINYGNGTFIVVGDYGAIYTSNDLVTWTNRKSSLALNLEGLVYGNEIYVAWGLDKIYSSHDGTTWTERPHDYINDTIKDVAYGNGVFVAVGWAGTLQISHDGITWISSDSIRKLMLTYETVYSIAYGQGIFVATNGGGTVLTSPNGDVWTVRLVDENLIYAAYLNDMFIAWTSNYGSGTTTIFTSPDGEIWTEIISKPQFEIVELTFGNGVFTAVSRFGSVYTSPDLTKWTISVGMPGGAYSIAFGGGFFVAVGYKSINDSGFISTSTDGMNWKERNSGVTDWFQGVSYANRTFFVWGDYDVLLQSDPVGGPEVISTPTILSGPTGGLEKVSYSFSTGGSYSNLDHPVQYLFDWGDGTNSGWLSVGTTSASKSWTSAGIYNVRAQAKCANHTSVFSSWSEALLITIYRSPSPPTNIQASDGTHMDKVEVSWTASLGATSYTIYRATSGNNRARKTVLGSTSETFFNDTTAVPKTTYYYCVKASNPYSTSDLSSYDAGYRSDGCPPVPTDVSATDGTHTDKVQVTWTGSPWATSYTVYRATSTSRRATKVPVGTISATTYDDTTASAGVTYYYYVTATNSYGESGYSAYDTGYR